MKTVSANKKYSNLHSKEQISIIIIFSIMIIKNSCFIPIIKIIIIMYQ